MSEHSTEVAAREILAGLDERELRAPSNGIEVAYDEFGDPGGTPLLLVMGLGMQMVAWDERFCELLARRGYRVIRFDNRDIGHTTRLDSAPVPSRAAMFSGLGRPSYLLTDMATDAIGLLDHLGIERVHVAGVSMGGMIAQTMAIEHPGRVHSLASMMSTTGSRWLRMPKWKAMVTLMAKPPADADAYMRLVTRTFKVIGSPAYPMTDESFRVLMQVSYRRCFYPDGVARQLHAINSSGNRTKRLRRLDLPAVVIHGAADPLIRPAAARATAAAIPGSRLRVVEGMGHDLPNSFGRRSSRRSTPTPGAPAPARRSRSEPLSVPDEGLAPANAIEIAHLGIGDPGDDPLPVLGRRITRSQAPFSGSRRPRRRPSSISGR